MIQTVALCTIIQASGPSYHCRKSRRSVQCSAKISVATQTIEATASGSGFLVTFQIQLRFMLMFADMIFFWVFSKLQSRKLHMLLTSGVSVHVLAFVLEVDI